LFCGQTEDYLLKPFLLFWIGIHKLACQLHDSWSLSHLGYLYPGTTPVMIKLDHKRSCPWVKIAQVTKALTIITKVPAKGHTGSLPSTSLDHHISMLVASRGNLSFTDPISCFRDDCPSTISHAVAVVRSSQSRGKPSSRNHGEEICHDPCHAKFVAIANGHQLP